MAENHWSPGTNVVGVPLAISILHLGADALLEKTGRTADGAEGADRRIDAAGNVALGTFEQLLVTGGHARFSLNKC